MEITTDKECIDKILRALPFMTVDTGYNETKELIMKLHAEHKVMKNSLRYIASMSESDEIDEDNAGFTEWGLDREETIEMAYDNAINEAKFVLETLK